MMLCLGFTLLRMPTEKVWFDVKDQQVCLRVLRDQSHQNRGFQLVETLCPNEGLLYILPESKKPGFWMKNVIQPLDIVFIDMNGQVLDNVLAYPLRKDVITPPINATYAIEIMGGQAANFQLIKGNILSEKTLSKLKGLAVWED
jgi:uncharacterized membrane protein (UPF0127 family)